MFEEESPAGARTSREMAMVHTALVPEAVGIQTTPSGFNAGPGTMGSMPGLHINVSLSGGAALGAYQAGAMAALLVAVQHLRKESPDSVIIDALGGASAGSLVALLSATAHVSGIDPVALLRAAWVDEVSVGLLMEGSGRAPLGSHGLRRRMEEIIVSWEPEGPPSATAPVALHISLTGLRGLTYHIDGLRGPGTIPAVTYDDWDIFRLEPGFDRATLFTPADACPADVALASAANPGVFAPKLLDRSRVGDAYERAGITDLPDHRRLWYSDGGLIQSEPVGRVMDAHDLVDPDGGDRHLMLMIDPRAEGPSTGRRWSDPDEEPEWLHALARALELIPAKNLYDDVRRVERDNRRIALVEDLVGVFARTADEQTADDLREVLGAHGKADDLPDDLAGVVEQALRSAGGTDGKRTLHVDVLTPLLLSDDERKIEGLLAGELLGDFGGFLDRRLRYSDFVLGYATTLQWLPDGLDRLDVPALLVRSTVAAVEEAHEHDWTEHNRGRFALGDLPWSGRVDLARIAGRATVSAVTEMLTQLRVTRRASGVATRLRGAVASLPRRK